MNNINCVECEGGIRVEENIMMGEILQCSDCGVELEVIALNPLQIDLAPEIEEDWGE